MDKAAKTGWEEALARYGFCIEDKYLLKRSMLYTFLMGLSAHGFVLVNLSISHDAVFDFYDGLAAHKHQIGLGRILEPFYREITGSGLLMPWCLGIMAFFWLGIAVFLVCKLFGLSDRMEVLLTAGIMTVNISVTAVAAAYTPWLAADMFALLFAVAGVYFWRHYGKSGRKGHLFLGVLSVIASLSVYQCYLAVTVVLMILLSMQNIFDCEGAAKVFRDGMAGVGMLAAGGAGYYFLMKFVCALAGMPLAKGYYDSVTNLWDNRESVAERIVHCLKEEATHFFAKDENVYPYQLIWTVNCLIGCVCICLALRLVRQKRNEWSKGEWALLALLTAALPFAAYMMRLLNLHVHDLMVYSVWLLYLVPVLLGKWTVRGDGSIRRQRTAVDTAFHAVTAVFLSFIIFSCIQTDNAVYVKKRVESEATLSLMTEAMTLVDQTEGYVPGETAVTFVGDIADVMQELPGTDRVKGISGCNKSAAITYKETYQAYFDHVMLRDVKVVFEDTVKEEAERLRMPAYPQAGYVQMVDQTVVVKWN